MTHITAALPFLTAHLFQFTAQFASEDFTEPNKECMAAANVPKSAYYPVFPSFFLLAFFFFTVRQVPNWLGSHVDLFSRTVRSEWGHEKSQGFKRHQL